MKGEKMMPTLLGPQASEAYNFMHLGKNNDSNQLRYLGKIVLNNMFQNLNFILN